MNCPRTGKECPATSECPWWVELTAGSEKHGRCAVAWLPVLIVELKGVIANVLRATPGKSDS